MTRSNALAVENDTNVRDGFTKAHLVGAALGLLWRVLPTATIRLTNRLFFTPKRRPLSDAQQQILKTGTAFELAVKQKRFKCWRWGSGKTVILVHGWSGRGVQLGCFVEPLVQAGFAVVTYDAPGHGESKGRVASYFEAIETLRAVVREERALAGIIAHSMGGGAAISGAAQEQLNVPMVLIAPALRLSELIGKIFSQYGVPAAVKQAAIGEFEKEWPYTMANDDPWQLMGQIHSHTLVIHDTNDRQIPIAHTEDLVPQHPGFSLVTTTGLGHRTILKDRSVIDTSTAHLRRNVS